MFKRLDGDNFIRETFINLRPLAFSAVALATGAAFCYAALFHGVSLFFSSLFLIPFLLYVLFAKKKIRAAFVFFLVLTFLCVGMGGFALRMQNYHSQKLEEGSYVLTGEIAEYVQEDSYARILLKDVTADGHGVDGNVRVTLYETQASGEEGMKIRFAAEVKPVGKAYRYNVFHADMVLGNIKYTATAKETPVLTGEKQSAFSAVRAKIKEVLYGNFSQERAGIAYALTTGNSDGIEEGLLTSVRYGGVAHIFAVSGLHIGVVYAALLFLCKKLKTPKVVRLILPLAVAFLFSGVCGFSPSSLRAFLVCAATAISSFLGLRADGIEGAGFACGVILLVNPVYLFSVGFQLSAAAYIGIVTLSPKLEKLFSPIYNRFPVCKKPASTLSVMLSVQLCLFPIMLNAFGYVSVWGLLLNLLIIPLFSLFFPVLLAGILLSCLFPAAAFVLLFLPETILSVFAAFFYVTDFSTLVISGFSFGSVAVFAFFALLSFASGRMNGKKKGLQPLTSFLIAAILFDVCAGSFALADDCRVTQSCYYNGSCCALIQTAEADILLVNDEVNISRAQNLLSRHGGNADVIILVAEDVNGCANALLSVPVPTFYVRQGERVELRTREIISADTFSIGKINFEFKGENTLLFEYDGVTGVFNGAGYGADFTVFSLEERDGLIFTINRGILSVS